MLTEKLVKLTDPALLALAEIIHGADVSDERTTPFLGWPGHKAMVLLT